MSWYRTGTVTVTNNSTAVTGSGTAWVDAAQVGESFLGPDGQVYEITAINSATSLTIAPAYKGSTASAQAYALMPTQGYLRDLAAQAAALVNSYAAVRDNAGQGKFAAGTVTAPSLRGVSDDNTGVNLPGGDVLQLVTGGAARLTVASDGKVTGDIETTWGNVTGKPTTVGGYGITDFQAQAQGAGHVVDPANATAGPNLGMDPNSPTTGLAVVFHDNGPSPDFYYLLTYWWAEQSPSGNCGQFAFGYLNNKVYYRSRYSGTWTAWAEK